MKKACVAVTNDLSTDQRVDKICRVLKSEGYEVTLVGRKLQDSKPISRDYKTKRFRLLFSKGALFYASYNLRLFRHLLFKKYHLVYANDLDTLLASRMATRLKRSNLIYDSHEYFTEVPELQNRKMVKGIWTRIEKSIFPKLNYVITVNESIAKLYHEKYGNDVRVMRNIPEKEKPLIRKSRGELGLPEDKRLVVLQGAWINVDRGGEELVSAMNYLANSELLIIGGGDALPALKKIVESENDLKKRVHFLGKLPYDEMMAYTACSDVGVTLDKDTNLNYRYSLPNKLFDYLRAGTPVVCSNLVEIVRIVEGYEVGVVAVSHEPKLIAKTIEGFISDIEKYALAKVNCMKVIEELNWEKESQTLVTILKKIECL